jgi:hypothetical protein
MSTKDAPPTVPFVRTDKNAPKVKEPTTVKESKAPKAPPQPKKPPVWTVHFGHVVEQDGERAYQVEKFEHPDLASALTKLNKLANSHAGNGIRELILSFPKVK